MDGKIFRHECRVYERACADHERDWMDYYMVKTPYWDDVEAVLEKRYLEENNGDIEAFNELCKGCGCSYFTYEDIKDVVKDCVHRYEVVGSRGVEQAYYDNLMDEIQIIEFYENELIEEYKKFCKENNIKVEKNTKKKPKKKSGEESKEKSKSKPSSLTPPSPSSQEPELFQELLSLLSSSTSLPRFTSPHLSPSGHTYSKSEIPLLHTSSPPNPSTPNITRPHHLCHSVISLLKKYISPLE
ncbi:unnamed protein product [Moneuplotes crassus]|uniref:Uncharacterized protein n=1 Tax=Euplotes crassus TaxID=5936 RepID=A0AAD1XUP8_EUPCR|nr:unnamed protein product [Moneuplotes crassus]